jgi:uncharacterized protein YbjT (DUF2867 family)
MTHSDRVSTEERLAVTGALGFVGTRLVPRLVERRRPVVAVVRPGRDARSLETLGVEVRRANLDAPGTLSGAFDGVAEVLHLSGMAQVPALLPAWSAAGVRRGVFVSSAGVHTRLASRGAEAKRDGEAALRASGMDHVILRPSMIYGTPDDRNIARLLRWQSRIPIVPLPDGGTTLQQPIHVDDLIAALLSALERVAGTRAEYDVGGPEALPLREVFRVCAQELGRPVWMLPVPSRALFQTVLLLRRLRLPCPVRPEQVLRLAESKAVDVSRMRAELGIEPRALRDGIREEIAALRAAT